MSLCHFMQKGAHVPVRVNTASEKCMQPMRPLPPLQSQPRSLYGLLGHKSCPISSVLSWIPAEEQVAISLPSRVSGDDYL